MMAFLLTSYGCMDVMDQFDDRPFFLDQYVKIFLHHENQK